MAVIIFVVTYMLHLVRLQIHLNGVLQVGCYGSMSCYGAVFVDRLSLGRKSIFCNHSRPVVLNTDCYG